MCFVKMKITIIHNQNKDYFNIDAMLSVEDSVVRV